MDEKRKEQIRREQEREEERIRRWDRIGIEFLVSIAVNIITTLTILHLVLK